jgi:hypothetical protein
MPQVLDTPKCWKMIYGLLEMYGSIPETKTITHRVSLSPDMTEANKTAKKYNLLNEGKAPTAGGGLKDEEDVGTGTPQPQPKEMGLLTQERTRLVIFGVAKIHRTRLMASLSGLKLEAEITALHSSTTWRKKLRPASLECSLTGQVGRAMIVLLEGVPPNQQ